jgi:photosystem II stability/assembly factor-like uncharacterized protein
MARPAIPASVYAATNKYNWTKQEDIDLFGGYYTSAASSASGSKLVLSVNDGGEGTPEQLSPLYISSNYGVTWKDVTEDADSGVRNHWMSVDVSNDGQTIVAASEWGSDVSESSGTDGKIVLSQNGGDSWTNITPDGGDNWEKVVVSGDGSTVAAYQYYSGDVYVTGNDGVDWAVNPVGGNVFDLESMSISDNGNKILVGGENSDDYDSTTLISDDSGDSWTDISPDPEDYIYSVSTAISSDGSKIAVSTTGWNGGENDSIFVSENDGEDWTDVAPEAETHFWWYGLAMSDDGSTLSVLDDLGDRMYVTSDSGANWTQEDPGQNYEDTNNWVAFDFNEDGSQAIAAGSYSAYTSAEIDTTTTVTLDDAEGGKTVTLTTPSGTNITCHSAVKESALAAKDGAYSYPLGLIDFCFSGADTDNEINLIFVTDLTPSQVAVRKYNTTNGSYSTISDATVTETTHGGQHALQVTYNIVDNGPLDLDPDIGEVADPVGLAVAEISAPNTGIAPVQGTTNASLASLLAGVMVASSLLISPIRRIANRTIPKK